VLTARRPAPLHRRWSPPAAELDETGRINEPLRAIEKLVAWSVLLAMSR
jgi:hypothetical protein